MTLGWIGDGTLIPVLVERLANVLDRDAALVAWGVLAYRGQTTHRQLVALATILRQGTSSARMLAAWTIARAGGTAAEPLTEALRTAARDSDVETRAWAATALAQKDATPHHRLLEQMSRDSDPRVQVAAIRGLGRGRTPAVIALCNVVRRIWRQLRSGRDRLAGPELHALLVGLDSLLPHARLAVVQQLALQILDTADAGTASQGLSRQEAQAIDLAHCAASVLRDLGLRRPMHTGSCGPAKAQDLTPAWRRRLVPTLIGRVEREASWKLIMLRRYLVDPLPSVRTAAAEAVEVARGLDVGLAIKPLLEPLDSGVFAALSSSIAANAKRHGADPALGGQLLAYLMRINPVTDPEPVCAGVAALGALRYMPALPYLNRLREQPSWAARNCVVETLRRSWPKISIGPVKPLPRALPRQLTVGALPRVAVLVTNRGDIHLEFLEKLAPATVANFLLLARAGAYRGLRFHRVVPGFVVQGGDPRGDGFGGMGYTLPCELSHRPYRRGSVGMALSGRDSGSSQFFVTLGRQPHLDGRYTQFARVLRGIEIVDRLQVGDEIKDLQEVSMRPRGRRSGAGHSAKR
jgi:cyclophilin family peptidyl-prolyl cis-trans isomerase